MTSSKSSSALSYKFLCDVDIASSGSKHGYEACPFAQDWFNTPRVSLRHIEKTAAGGCPACRVHYQAILLCMPEFQHCLDISVTFTPDSRVDKRNEEDCAVSFHVCTDISFKSNPRARYRIFTHEVASESSPSKM